MNIMFYVRETPWHGLGTKVQEAPTSKDALILAGLDWHVVQEPVYTGQNEMVQGYKANVRDSDRKVLGVVTDRYKIVQNEEAFSFTDALLGEGVRYETAGSLQGGKSVWLLAHLPHEYIISGERISPYLLFSNTHDGSGAVKVAITPIRVVCCNTLNLALQTAKRSWSMNHTGNVKDKMEEAKNTLFLADRYMEELGKEFENLRKITLSDKKVMDYIEILLPIEDGATPQALPEVITPERFTRMALSALNTTPKLNECTPMSFLAALMNAAQLGLEPNTPLGQAFLIPYNNKGKMECQFQLGYKGLMKKQ